MMSYLLTRLRRFNPPSVKGSRRRRGGRALLTTLLFGLVGALMLPAPPASAEVFGTITTPGDGWDVTFHPTNQNYAFFAHHRGIVFGCFYRLDPDGAGSIEQGDGCFNGVYDLNIGGAVGQKSSAWVTSDGNTAYVPRNKDASTLIAKVDISDADPMNWSVTGTVDWAAAMQYFTNSVMVDDVLYALSSSGWLTLDTTNNDTAGQVAFNGTGPDYYSTIYEADGKLWAVSSDWYLHCFDPADGALCDHNGWTNGKSTNQFTTSTPHPDAVVEYRNTDGSFGGFCVAHGTNWATYACLNADGLLDPNAGQPDAMVNPFEQMQNAMGNQNWGYSAWYGQFYVTPQHQVIIHEPLNSPQDYYCWDYTTQAACANFNISGNNAYPGKAYTIVQDPWIDTCFWSNADDKKIGVWNSSHTGAFATSGGECDLTLVSTTPTLAYDPQGGTGQPGNQTGNAASNVTVSSTVPTRAGYTFVKWNTVANGSGTDYVGGATYTLPNSGTATLYAQWQINTVTLTYDPQGGTGQPGNQTGNAASNVTVSSTVPTRAGYTFTGWDTVANGSGTDYAGGATYTLPNSGTDTLYAQWQINTVTLTYDPQGGTGQPGNQTGNAASNVTVSTTAPTRTGYTFAGWNAVADGSGTGYAGGATYQLPNSGTDTLYAQWAPEVANSNATVVTLTYDPQGGLGQPGNQVGVAASNVTVSSTVPTRAGYTFTGWDTVANGSGTGYAGGATYQLPNSGTDTLYAQWVSVATTGAETPTPVPVLPALLLLLTSLLLAALGIRRFV